jgi:hypothetical protein
MQGGAKPLSQKSKHHDALKAGMPARAMIELAICLAGISHIS